MLLSPYLFKCDGIWNVSCFYFRNYLIPKVNTKDYLEFGSKERSRHPFSHDKVFVLSGAVHRYLQITNEFFLLNYKEEEYDPYYLKIIERIFNNVDLFYNCCIFYDSENIVFHLKSISGVKYFNNNKFEFKVPLLKLIV